jgi:hypothetical protein
MDELALINKLKSLEMSWVSLDRWLKFWVLLVVIGVSVELVVILVEYFDELHDFRRGIMHVPDRPSRLLLFFALLGAGLVAIGVAGEFFIHIKAGKVETEMRDATGSLVSIADGKAEEARERASRNEKEAAQLRKEAVQIEESVKWRRLSKDQQTILAKQLKQFAGQSALVQFNIGDTESNAFAITIASALLAAHWKVNQPYGGQFLGGSAKPTERISFNLDTGVRVGKVGNPASRALVNQLNKLGFDAFEDLRLDAVPQEVSRNIFVVVDPRPEGPQGEAKLNFEEAKRKQEQSSQTTK